MPNVAEEVAALKRIAAFHQKEESSDGKFMFYTWSPEYDYKHMTYVAENRFTVTLTLDAAKNWVSRGSSLYVGVCDGKELLPYGSDGYKLVLSEEKRIPVTEVAWES